MSPIAPPDAEAQGRRAAMTRARKSLVCLNNTPRPSIGTPIKFALLAKLLLRESMGVLECLARVFSIGRPILRCFSCEFGLNCVSERIQLLAQQQPITRSFS